MDDQALGMRKCDILKIRFDLIAYNVAMERIERWRRNGERHYVTITNPHSVMLCGRDSEMCKATDITSMVVAKGLLRDSKRHCAENIRACGSWQPTFRRSGRFHLRRIERL